MGKTGEAWCAAIAVVACIFASSNAASAQDAWVTVSAADGALHYQSPVEPKITTSDAKDGDTPYTITLYVSTVPGLAVIGSYTIYHSNDVVVDPDLVVGGFIKGMKGDLISSSPAPYQRGPNDTLKGVLAVAKSGDTSCRLRVVVEDVRAYAVAACGLNGNDASADIDRVLGSISVTKP